MLTRKFLLLFITVCVAFSAAIASSQAFIPICALKTMYYKNAFGAYIELPINYQYSCIKSPNEVCTYTYDELTHSFVPCLSGHFFTGLEE
ncbi:hypothetical protein LX64_00418 [Chitinophaga skermanii]|uniref:YD repeat-containing protein n=1 Tax=Chitinophaga skermanii TaxID=331697 RepID=A0A327R2G2_9BACT|nr:hypothetical protein [Chitinophaga skermanii]RAJ10811.1 hypothetical protein LX64_00418 [Chitinophaga skermanii]